MVDRPRELESKFTKSGTNRQTENGGLAVLLTDARFQTVPFLLKRDIAQRFGIYTEYGTNAFDAVMTPSPSEPLSAFNLDAQVDVLRLVEMKTTRKPIKDSALGGFFFGATEREYNLARKLGDRYLFAFVVLNKVNVYGREFFVLLTFDELESRTRNKRIQFQVNLQREWLGGTSRFGDGPILVERTRVAEKPDPYG